MYVQHAQQSVHYRSVVSDVYDVLRVVMYVCT